MKMSSRFTCRRISDCDGDLMPSDLEPGWTFFLDISF